MSLTGKHSVSREEIIIIAALRAMSGLAAVAQSAAAAKESLLELRRKNPPAGSDGFNRYWAAQH